MEKDVQTPHYELLTNWLRLLSLDKLFYKANFNVLAKSEFYQAWFLGIAETMELQKIEWIYLEPYFDNNQ